MRTLTVVFWAKVHKELHSETLKNSTLRYACSLSLGYADLKWQRIGRKFVHTSGLVIVIISFAVVIFVYAFGIQSFLVIRSIKGPNVIRLCLDLNHMLKEEVRILILLASSMTSQVSFSMLPCNAL